MIITLATVETVVPLTDKKFERNMRAVDHAIAQQSLEGLTVSETTIADMKRAARGEIADEEVIANIYSRFKHVPMPQSEYALNK